MVYTNIECKTENNTPLDIQLCNHSIHVTAAGNAHSPLQTASRRALGGWISAASVHLCILLPCPQILEHTAQCGNALRVAGLLLVSLYGSLEQTSNLARLHMIMSANCET